MESISSTPGQSTPKRIKELDALRGLAAVSVVLFHYTYALDYNSLLAKTYFLKFGNLGLQLFFMISGFVILMTLDHTRDYKQFIISRFSRLYPVYWFCIGLTVAVVSFFSPSGGQITYSVKQVLVNLTMLQHFVKISDVDGAYWTLAVELVFYFWAALLVYCTPRRIIPYACFCWLLLSTLSLLGVLPFRNYLNQVFILPHAGFFVAGLCFYLSRVDGFSVKLWLLLLCSFLVNALALQSGPDFAIPVGIYLVFYLVFYLLIRKQEWLTFLTARFFLFLGAVSYPLYLSHEVIGSYIIRWLKQWYNREWFYVSATLLIMMGVAYLIHCYIEKPAMRYIRQRFLSSQRISPQRLNSELPVS
jgi:peptidoglycan/LPS O-acetylase OafA/YrhL